LNFTQLEPSEFHDLMLLQPADTRTAGDSERLARLAVSASRLEIALQHVRESLDQPDITGRRFERVLLAVELLMQLDRRQDAIREAQGWKGRPERCRIEATGLANLLAGYGNRSDAAALLAAAAKNKGVPAGDRYAILLRQAEFESDPNAAADLCWQVEQAGYLPSEKLRWACHRMNAAKQSDRVVAMLEQRLRRGVDVSPRVLSELEAAYLALQRPVDARRAYEQDPPPRHPTGQSVPTPRDFFNQRFRGGMF
jgi:hypothetical protein